LKKNADFLVIQPLGIISSDEDNYMALSESRQHHDHVQILLWAEKKNKNIIFTDNKKKQNHLCG
jgi:hypothetical protein